MNNAYAISGLVRMLSKTSETIETMVLTHLQVPVDAMGEMLLDELHHLQILTLEITKRIVGDDRAEADASGSDSSGKEGEAVAS